MILLVCLITVKELGFRFKLVNFLSYLPRIDQLRFYKVQSQYHKAVLQSCDLPNFETSISLHLEKRLSFSRSDENFPSLNTL